MPIQPVSTPVHLGDFAEQAFNLVFLRARLPVYTTHPPLPSRATRDAGTPLAFLYPLIPPQRLIGDPSALDNLTAFPASIALGIVHHASALTIIFPTVPRLVRTNGASLKLQFAPIGRYRHPPNLV